MKLKSLQSSLKISKIKYLGATRKFVALEILLREFCFFVLLTDLFIKFDMIDILKLR